MTDDTKDAQPRYVYGETYGMVYRFTKRNWDRLLVAVSRGIEVDYSKYGKTLFMIDHHITDLDADSADEILNRENQ